MTQPAQEWLPITGNLNLTYSSLTEVKPFSATTQSLPVSLVLSGPSAKTIENALDLSTESGPADTPSEAEKPTATDWWICEDYWPGPECDDEDVPFSPVVTWINWKHYDRYGTAPHKSNYLHPGSPMVFQGEVYGTVESVDVKHDFKDGGYSHHYIIKDL